MSIEKQIAEAKKIRDQRYTTLIVEGTLTSELKKFIREQTLTGLYEYQFKILDLINTGKDEKIKGEFDYISTCIRIKNDYEIQHVSDFNRKQNNEGNKFTYNGNERKHGYVASFVQFIPSEVLTDVKPLSHIFAKTKTRVNEMVREMILKQI